MSPEYKAAYEAHNVASQAYTKVAEAYRAQEIGDAEFLAARKVYDEATAIYDAAYAKEAA